MNRYSIFATTLAALLGLSSCSNENLTAETLAEQAPDGRITFRLGGTAASGSGMTRAAASTTSLDYEANIQNVYVAAYKNNNLTAAVQATELTPGSGDWTADVDASGMLDIYFIVNADATLASGITGLAKGTAPSVIENLKVTQTPGAYQATATDGFFPMTGKLSNQTINTQDKTNQGTVISDPVSVKRMAARIDIDTDGLPANFEVTGVTVNNRYDESLLVHNDHSMKALAAPVNNQPTDEYVIDHSTEMPYQGHIYLYEDLDGDVTAEAGESSTAGAQTELIIHGKYTIDGVEHIVHPVVKFDNTADGGTTQIKVQRNHIYNIKLLPETQTETLKSIAAVITVIDWETGETITQSTEKLTDRTTLPATIAFSDLVNCTESAGNLTSTDETAVSFTVTVTNEGSTTSKLVCVEPNDGIGILITPSATVYNLDGTSEQAFTVTIDANGGDAARTFIIRAENLLNKDTYKEFTVTQVAAGS